MMAIKRCPYCRSIIDERDQFCNNCGTQLLFPEDEKAEEDIPGEKILDVDEKTGGELIDGDLSFDELDAVSPTAAVSSRALAGDLTAETEPKKAARKSRKSGELELTPERVFKTSELPEMGEAATPEASAGRTAADMLFEDAFPGKKTEPQPAAKTQAPAPVTQPVSPIRDESSLSASTEEIEEIARMMSSRDKETDEKKPAAPPEKKAQREIGLGDTALVQKKIEDIRQETLHGIPRDRRSESSELKKSAADVPPWATGLRVDPPIPLQNFDIPELEDDKHAVPPAEPSAGLTDILNKLEQEPGASNEAEVEAGSEAAVEFGDEEPSAARTLPADEDQEGVPLDSWSDRLGRERFERVAVRPTARRSVRGGSKLKAKIYDILLVVLGWVAAVWLATRILSVSMTEIFGAAPLPLLLFLLTLGVAYFFLFLYFLGETLGDRLSS